MFLRQLSRKFLPLIFPKQSPSLLPSRQPFPSSTTSSHSFQSPSPTFSKFPQRTFSSTTTQSANNVPQSSSDQPHSRVSTATPAQPQVSTANQAQAPAAQAQASMSTATVVEISQRNFSDLVVKSPMPVLLLFYASWVEDCQKMIQKLEEIVKKHDGLLRLAKVNVDTQSDICAQLQVEVVPTTYFLFSGRTVDRITGIPEDRKIDEAVEKVLKMAGGKGVKPTLQAAEQALEAGNVAQAASLYTEILNNKQLKAEAVAIAGLALCALAEGKITVATALVQTLSDNYKDDLVNPLVKKALSAIDLASTAESGTDVSDLEAKVKQNPDDLQSMIDLASKYSSIRKTEQAIDVALKSIRKDKMFNEEAARKLLLKIFEALGPENPLTISGRKRLSSLWFL